MIFNLDPWKLDVDLEETKALYEVEDYSIDKSFNEEFVAKLNSEQKEFFDSLAVDLMKVEVDRKIYDIPEDDETPAAKIYRMTVNFLMRGGLLAVPEYQKDIYSDEEIFGEDALSDVEVTTSDEEEYIKVLFNGIGTGVVFKHPGFHYEDEKFETWDCGYILGSVLIFEELSEEC